MRTFVIELAFIDGYGVNQFRTVEVAADSISEATSSVSDIIEYYENEQDMDYVGSTLLDIVIKP